MNIVKCLKCKEEVAEFTDNTDFGEGNGNDEYWCEDCNVTTVYYYSKKYDKPFILGQ
tara:strand:+ start:891 stop:1061 length:171 start_codon:yes stop_codon:yes gene_type:complete